MARTSRNKPTSTGPGRGSPRTRTAARPGERATSGRSRTRPVEVSEERLEGTPAGRPQLRRGGALGITWRLIAVAVVLAMIGLTLAQSLRVYFTQAAELASLRAEIQSRKQEIGKLEDELQRWEDPEFVKAQARDRLGWVMPGDTGYRVIGPDGEPLGGDNAVLHPTDKPPGQWHERMWGSVVGADQPVPDPQQSARPSSPPPTILPPPTPSKSQ